MSTPHFDAPPDPAIRPDPDRVPLSLPGMRTAAVRSGVKPSGELDLALIDVGQPVTAAAVFTTNELCAPPVTECRARLERDPHVRTVVINSGNANAMTGKAGANDARTMLDRVESRVGGPALVLSTGVIGVPLPMDKVLAGIDRASEELVADAGHEVARAMLTTDTRAKSSSCTVTLPADGDDPERIVTVTGVAKGSGMIHPHMATMLAVIATDAPFEPADAREMLAAAVDASFHTITVDGDTSTNDAVVLLAGGADMPVVRRGSRRAELMAAAVQTVAIDLALAIVRDGEGATRVARITVEGARSDAEAREVARSVACSSLVKTALAGGDPNWGRILSAAANAGVGLDGDRLRLRLGGVEVFAGGMPLDYDQDAADRAFSADEVAIDLSLGLGDGSSVMYTTDLTKGYVEINSEYTT
jgi:glutamate N-acetyltransferase/amino-acid N-acetyltransferase